MSIADAPKCSRVTNGVKCTQPARKGTTLCRKHGGNAPQVQAKARERILEMNIRGELSKREITPVADPLKALMQVAGTALAWLDFCQEELAKLGTLDYSDAKQAQDVKPVVALYERSMDRAAGILAKMVALGIQDRVARSVELEAEANMQAMRALIRAARENPDASEDELLLGMLAGTVKA